VLQLAASQVLQKYMSALSREDGLNLARENVEDFFSVLLSGHPTYYQIQLVGVNNGGMELVKVRRDLTGIEVATPDKLGRLEGMEYFESPLGLARGQVYLSDMELDQGSDSSRPKVQPVLRVASPVYTDASELFGVVVINLDFEQFLQWLTQEMEKHYQNIIFVNGQGDYLAVLDTDDRFSVDYSRTSNILDDYPFLSKLFSASLPESWLIGKVNGDKKVFFLQRFNFERYGKKKVFDLVLVESYGSLTKHASILLQKLLLYSATLVVLTALIAYIFSRMVSRNLPHLTSAVRHYVLGHPAEDMPTKISNEIGVLADALKQMMETLNQQAEDLKESQDKFRQLVENIDEVFWIADSEPFKFTYVSECFSHLWGLPVERLLEDHQLWFSKIHPDDLFRVQAEFKGWFDNFDRGLDVEYRLVNDKGEIAWVHDRGRALKDAEGRVIQLTGVADDITSRKVAEREVEEYRNHLEELVDERTKELESAYNKIKELERLKTMFIASMSHELRTPLNSIIGFTGVVLQGMTGELNEQQRDKLQRVYGSGKHLLELVTDIIDISKIEAGRASANVSNFVLGEMIQDAVKIVQPQADEKGLALNVSEIPDIEMKSDRRRLFQSLLNCLTNAVKYTEEGSVDLGVKTEGKKLYIRISDTGIGMAKADIEKLFSPFHRIPSHLTSRVSGTGLGLYLTKKMLKDILLGDITVESQPDEGSTFTLIMPIEIF
jgi:PAS domain S-box-containing protein